VITSCTNSIDAELVEENETPVYMPSAYGLWISE